MCFIMNEYTPGHCINHNALFAKSSCLKRGMELGGNSQRIGDKIIMKRIEITGIKQILVIYIKNLLLNTNQKNMQQ